MKLVALFHELGLECRWNGVRMALKQRESASKLRSNHLCEQDRHQGLACNPRRCSVDEGANPVAKREQEGPRSREFYLPQCTMPFKKSKAGQSIERVRQAACGRGVL